MSGNGTLTRPSFEKARRQAIVADFYARSMSVAKIAQRLDVDREVVVSDVQDIVSRWEDATKRSVARLVAQEIAKLNRLEVELWREWERSRRSKNGADVRYLREIRQVIDQRAKFLGLHAPKRQHVRFEGQQSPEWTEEIDRLAASDLARVGIDALDREIRETLENPQRVLEVRTTSDRGPGEE